MVSSNSVPCNPRVYSNPNPAESRYIHCGECLRERRSEKRQRKRWWKREAAEDGGVREAATAVQCRPTRRLVYTRCYVARAATTQVQINKTQRVFLTREWRATITPILFVSGCFWTGACASAFAIVLHIFCYINWLRLRGKQCELSFITPASWQFILSNFYSSWHYWRQHTLHLNLPLNKCLTLFLQNQQQLDMCWTNIFLQFRYCQPETWNQ